MQSHYHHIPLKKVLDKKAKSNKLMGEGHLYQSEYSCMCYYVFPNQENLNGIAPHVHKDCEDIEVLLEGEVLSFTSKKTALKIKSPAIILNKKNTIHSLIPSDPENVVLNIGFRSPKSYEGTSVYSEMIDAENVQVINKQCIKGVDTTLINAKETMYQTKSNIVNFYCSTHEISLGELNSPERVLINLGKDPIEIDYQNKIITLNVYDILYLFEPKPIKINISCNQAKIIELIPIPRSKKGKYENHFITYWH